MMTLNDADSVNYIDLKYIIILLNLLHTLHYKIYSNNQQINIQNVRKVKLLYENIRLKLCRILNLYADDLDDNNFDKMISSINYYNQHDINTKIILKKNSSLSSLLTQGEIDYIDKFMNKLSK